MIGFGCNASPWYAHDARCPGREGFHHGIDVAMACGTPLTSDVSGVVLSPSAPGSPGPAYGVNPFRIHTGDVDVLIGHTRQVFVHPGQQVRPGQRIALSSDSGAPDGCHLHFEVRPHGRRRLHRPRPRTLAEAVLAPPKFGDARTEVWPAGRKISTCPARSDTRAELVSACRRNPAGAPQALVCWRRPKVRLSSSAIQEASMTLAPTPTVTHELLPSEVSISTRVIASVPWPWSRMRTL